ncbi:piggyBac transposable element-derived protein 3-like [Myzus persicae]|uniref:piggyBac transposable element-derived protein 3-like n=1 Tax=Myzus persicae TaxID=13164 RepID=UPI000B931AE9|nr:piggyBac transposable element-derived protein 3-like [Myzus persicae]
MNQTENNDEITLDMLDEALESNLIDEVFGFSEGTVSTNNNDDDIDLQIPPEVFGNGFDETIPIRDPKWEDTDWIEEDVTWLDKLPDPPDSLKYPYSYFKMIIDDAIIKNLSEQTNLYSAQNNGFSLNTTPQEMEQFLGIYLFMSIVKMPSYRMFWSNRTRFNPVFETMSRNRFDNLRTNFHISDNDLMLPRDNPLHDKLFKIRPFISSVQNNFKKIQADEFCAIDEIIIPFKGRSQMKQYNQNKPHKWGIKVFAIASISGFIHDFEIYVGKGTLPATGSGLGISGDIVIRLLETVPKFKNYKVATDNWFNSYNLQCHLKFSGMLGIGTVRTNRLSGCTFKNEKDMKKSGRGTYDTKVDTTNKIVATKWYDNKFVHVVSNYKGIQPLDEVERWSTAKKKELLYLDQHQLKSTTGLWVVLTCTTCSLSCIELIFAFEDIIYV